MKFQYSFVVTLSLLLKGSYIQNANAFVSNTRLQQQQKQQASFSQISMASDDAAAKAFTDYMAKSHEEKLKALKDLEDKKNNEIKALKDELENVKESGNIVVSAPQTPVAPPPPPPAVEGSVEDLSAKLAAYQKFMSEYIVKAQLEKYEAVRAAEASITKKYKDKLNTFMLNGAAAPAETSASSEETKLFEQRNANLAAAAKAGKSRWGSQEVAKVSGIVVEKNTPTTPAQHTTNGAISNEPSLFEQRSANLAAAAKAGKSRWGSQEVEKVSGIVVEKTTPTTPALTENPPADASPEAIAAANHGLRADGGVGGLTLEQRVIAGAHAEATAVVPATQSPLYAMRNARVAEAAKAGKSRWGSMEVEKVKELLKQAPISNTIMSSPEIEAADHGLRADGGVSGPSLAERVNLGAQLLQ